MSKQIVGKKILDALERLAERAALFAEVEDDLLAHHLGRILHHSVKAIDRLVELGMADGDEETLH